MMQENIWITRPQPQGGTLGEILRQSGFNPFVSPVSTLSALPDADAIIHQAADVAQGIILTSQFALERVHQARISHDIPLFLTGEILKARAQMLGFTHTIAGQANAESLADRLVQDYAAWHFYYLHGNHLAYDMTGRLKGAGIMVQSAAIYRAEKIASFTKQAVDFLKQPHHRLVLFYSAQTARFFMELVQQAGLQQQLRHITACIFSPAMAKPLGEGVWGRIILIPSMQTDIVLDNLRSCLEPASI